MSSAELPADVETVLTDDTVSASAVVAATPSEIFAYLRDPANHAAISGDGTVHETVGSSELLGPDSEFRVKMTRGWLPYRIKNHVVEYDENRVIAWCHLGGHRWRWELEPADGGTLVTETYDQSTARVGAMLRLMGYPKGHLTNVARSVANVRDHFAS